MKTNTLEQRTTLLIRIQELLKSTEIDRWNIWFLVAKNFSLSLSILENVESRRVWIQVRWVKVDDVQLQQFHWDPLPTEFVSNLPNQGGWLFGVDHSNRISIKVHSCEPRHPSGRVEFLRRWSLCFLNNMNLAFLLGLLGRQGTYQCLKLLGC